MLFAAREPCQSGETESHLDWPHSDLDIGNGVRESANLRRVLVEKADGHAMKAPSAVSRYDEFQLEAVAAIVEDFKTQRNGRFLLVIPTGGGKTYTAVKAVNQLFLERVLTEATDNVLWVAHRQELLEQAKDTFARFGARFPSARSFAKNVIFQMISSAHRALAEDPSIRMVVIDEAHHGAANSYQPLFSNPRIGVLGLTATPTRHDGKPLDFSRESYSIGFPDLVDRGIILRPEVRTVDGGTFGILDLDNTRDLEQLNTEARNRQIAQALLASPDDYAKVIIYVGTKQHAEDLTEALRATPLRARYESIAYVHGNKNSAGVDRAIFLAQEKKRTRSILINVEVLTEGYDDPKVNTVVMATPTRSKLVYMQAMGRAIRRDPNDDLKQAFVIEIQDKLPNIRYRIDNRWLYSDISDALEPAVRDIAFGDVTEFHAELGKLYDEFRVPSNERALPLLKDGVRYGLLLFKVYRGPNDHTHTALLIDNSNRLAVTNFYNFLSERMTVLARDHVNSAAALAMARADCVVPPVPNATQRLIYDAMCNCVSAAPDIAAAMPWITFVAMRLRRELNTLPQDLLDFLEGMINRDEIIETILRREFLPDSILLRVPLPLVGSIGRILTAPEWAAVDAVIAGLRNIKETAAGSDHRPAVRNLLDGHILPLPVGDAPSLVLIARSPEPYCYRL